MFTKDRTTVKQFKTIKSFFRKLYGIEATVVRHPTWYEVFIVNYPEEEIDQLLVIREKALKKGFWVRYVGFPKKNVLRFDIQAYIPYKLKRVRIAVDGNEVF